MTKPHLDAASVTDLTNEKKQYLTLQDAKRWFG